MFRQLCFQVTQLLKFSKSGKETGGQGCRSPDQSIDLSRGGNRRGSSDSLSVHCLTRVATPVSAVALAYSGLSRPEWIQGCHRLHTGYVPPCSACSSSRQEESEKPFVAFCSQRQVVLVSTPARPATALFAMSAEPILKFACDATPDLA